MAVVAFDTLKLADRLQAGGFSFDQARTAASAFADALSGTDLATKGDLTAAESRLENRIDAVKAELKAEIAAVESRLDNKIDLAKAELKTEMQAIRADLLKSMNGIAVINMATMLGSMFALAKLLGH